MSAGDNFSETEDGTPERAREVAAGEREAQPPGNPTPEYIEAQRQAALSCVASARRALRSGMIGTAETQLMLVEVHLRAMDPGSAAAEGEAGHE